MITFLNLHDYGRFGNRLFMIAGTIGLAIKNGYQFGFPAWEEQKYFKNPLPPMSRKFSEIPKHKIYRFETTMPMDFKDVPIMDGSVVFGFMQTQKYFEHCPEIVKHYFEMHDIETYVKEMIEPNSIAIHFRGTDYDGVHYPRCSQDYYEKALEKMPKKSRIYAFSDEIETFKKMFEGSKFRKRITFIDANNYMLDFRLMRECKYFVISNSTYAWWAAWLADASMVIAPRIWYGPTHKHNLDDIYAPGWIII
jgi:hypothetical protein